MTVAILGDVHGEARQLRALIDHVRRLHGTGVEFYSLGDLIDRGSDSKGVLDICVQS